MRKFLKWKNQVVNYRFKMVLYLLYLRFKILDMNIKTSLFIVFTILFSVNASAQKYKAQENVNVSKEWNDIIFSSDKTFVENIVNATQFSMLAIALKNENLRNALENEEMITVFAVTNTGFNSLSKTKRDSIVGNAEIFTRLVKFYSIAGRLDSHTLLQAVEKNGGKAYLSTLQGTTLGIRKANGRLQLFDSENNTATVIASDFYHKNGFFHIVDGVVFPIKE